MKISLKYLIVILGIIGIANCLILARTTLVNDMNSKREILGKEIMVTVVPSPISSASSSAILTPASTAPPIQIKETIQLLKTSIPVPIPPNRKVSIYLVHTSMVRNCDEIASSNIRGASETILQKENEKKQCESKLISDTQSCVDSCKLASDLATRKCFDNSYSQSYLPEQLVSCKELASNQALYCLDQCRQRANGCLEVSETYYTSLNDLLTKYCE